MNRYRTASTDTIQSTRRTLIAGLANPRLNATNRANITGWIAEADAELMRRAAVVEATEPTLHELRSGKREARTVADQNRLQWSYMS